jgi:dolichol-phosphate mannosyltransferase
VIRRVGQRGLSSAVLAGMTVARGDVLVVIDADLQHDERRIPDLVAAVVGGADVALGSRETDGGGYGSFGRRRLAVSRLGATVARRVIGVRVSDPMSGFFAVSRDRHQQLSGRLNPRGFKILLEFLARGPEPRVAEIGYVFGPRGGGSTKFSWSVVGAFALSVIELAVARRRGRRSSAG